MENINEWVEWMTRNPELAEKYYPEITQGLTEQIKKSEPFLTALIIQKLPDHFPNWKTEAEKYFGIKRTKIIQGYINLINAVLIKYEYPSDIEKNAVESVRNELIEQLEYWNKQIDIRFLLTTFIEGQEHTKHEYLKREIEQHGFISIKVDSELQNIKIFTAPLAVILTSKILRVQNMDDQTETTINGWNYLNTYIEAYKEGERYFEAEFKVSPNTIYGANAEQYVRDIHQNFFHVQHTGINEGWGYVKKQYPVILTHKAMKEFGYYSGIVNKVEEQAKKHPQLFAAFEKCEHNLPKQTETKTDKLKAELGKYGFFYLPKVMQLSEPNKQKLVELISTNSLPYSIAMFDFLGFLKHIENEHFKTKYKLNIGVAKWFNSDKDGRAVKGNISSLSDYSTENKNKYTAHTHKEKVNTDYQKLK